MPTQPHILVFDSGAGGLSVARAILKHRAGCRLSYIADNAGFPYGLMENNALISRVCTQVGNHIDLLQPDIVVIACNTASTLTLEVLRARYKMPFVGVVPAIKPATLVSKTGVIGVLATPATVNREYTLSLISEFAKTQKVLLHGSNRLVLMAEAMILDQPPDKTTLQEELEGLFNQQDGEKIDTVVLACTHFPLLNEHFPKHMTNHAIQWIDSNEAIARRVDYWVNQLGLTSDNGAAHNIAVLFTQDNCPATKSAYRQYLSSNAV